MAVSQMLSQLRNLRRDALRASTAGTLLAVERRSQELQNTILTDSTATPGQRSQAKRLHRQTLKAIRFRKRQLR